MLLRRSLRHIELNDRLPPQFPHETAFSRVELVRREDRDIYVVLDASSCHVGSLSHGTDIGIADHHKVHVFGQRPRFATVAPCPRAVDERPVDPRKQAQLILQDRFGPDRLQQQCA